MFLSESEGDRTGASLVRVSPLLLDVDVVRK